MDKINWNELTYVDGELDCAKSVCATFGFIVT